MKSQIECIHTPGPWHQGGRIDGSRFVHTLDGAFRGVIIADIPERNDKWEHLANANLIAAAPEMLEALKAIESCLAPNDSDLTAHMVRAAIAKAEGIEDGGMSVREAQ